MRDISVLRFYCKFKQGPVCDLTFFLLLQPVNKQLKCICNNVIFIKHLINLLKHIKFIDETYSEPDKLITSILELPRSDFGSALLTPPCTVL